MTKTQISELYVSIFNRASEKEGSEWWIANRADKTAAELADEMLATDAAETYFDSLPFSFPACAIQAILYYFSESSFLCWMPNRCFIVSTYWNPPPFFAFSFPTLAGLWRILLSVLCIE